MAEIVSLREKSDNELNEMLEAAQESMFNLRFQSASAGLKDTSELKRVKREIAQLKTVLANRDQAIAAAASEPAIAEALGGKEWSATTHFDYEESAWVVSFEDGDGSEVATAKVNLNAKRIQSRRNRDLAAMQSLVLSHEIAG